MARKSLLTNSQCEQIRALRKQGVPVSKLYRAYGVSESSMYKVLDGSYVARADDNRQAIPTVVVAKPVGATPSLFESGAAHMRTTHPLLQAMLDKAQHIDEVEIDEVTLAAAKLVCAKAELTKALAHAH